MKPKKDKEKQMQSSSHLMRGLSLVLCMLGIWQLMTRGISFDNSSAIQFLTTAVIILGLTI